ncbi:hypothetical protein LNP74_28480 [Klebsiella pneumoniae subsp. pneumoniae]|nr:hypothetical protein [Klebsiella pneumoniae subsp. pneumoniae]
MPAGCKERCRRTVGGGKKMFACVRAQRWMAVVCHMEPGAVCGGGAMFIDPDLTQNSWRLVLTGTRT